MNSEQRQFHSNQEGVNENRQYQSNQPLTQRNDDDIAMPQKEVNKGVSSGNISQTDAKLPVMEGKPMGGHKFGQENHPPTGDAPNNPSQNAGYSNAYLAKTDPMEEYCNDNNFKVPNQQGEPDYQQHKKAIIPGDADDKEVVKGSSNTSEHVYDQQSSMYGDNDPESPDYHERVEQQKVGGG